jgi:hypothetical protein
MIRELLEQTINEISYSDKFEISEFELGRHIYKLLKEEIESDGFTSFNISIEKINYYRGIPVNLHQTNPNAFSISIKLKS